jgi:type II secretion system protein I
MMTNGFTSLKWGNEGGKKIGLPDGFTLLEVLVSLAITAIAIVLLLQLFSSNLRAIAVSGDAISAAAVANDRLREILADPSLAEGYRSETRDNGYRMDISIAEVLQDRTDNLPAKLMEVALTVHWSEGSKDKKFTLRTMKTIDREKGL